MEEIYFFYKGIKVFFNIPTEEWIASIEGSVIGDSELFRNKSLKKLKESIDRHIKKEFTPIPIILFKKSYDNPVFTNAEITSFTENIGECWIKHHDGTVEKINAAAGDKYGRVTPIYACGHIHNEPILGEILELDKRIEEAKQNLLQLQKEKIHRIDSLERFDIRSYALTPEKNEGQD